MRQEWNSKANKSRTEP